VSSSGKGEISSRGFCIFGVFLDQERSLEFRFLLGNIFFRLLLLCSSLERFCLFISHSSHPSFPSMQKSKLFSKD
jgi:hypothetical protein